MRYVPEKITVQGGGRNMAQSGEGKSDSDLTLSSLVPTKYSLSRDWGT